MLLNPMWVLLTRLIMRAANFAVFVVLARSLSVGEFGFYGYVMSTALVLAIAFDLGLRQSGAWVIGRSRSPTTTWRPISSRHGSCLVRWASQPAG